MALVVSRAAVNAYYAAAWQRLARCKREKNIGTLLVIAPCFCCFFSVLFAMIVYLGVGRSAAELGYFEDHLVQRDHKGRCHCRQPATCVKA